MKDERKCYNCRKPIKGKDMVCKECKDKPIKSSSTFIIFDKI